jgi:hypothetical protein
VRLYAQQEGQRRHASSVATLLCRSCGPSAMFISIRSFDY